MAMIQSLNTAISGLRAQQRKVEITGNNIANVSTTAFKEGRALFHTLFSQMVSEGSAPSGYLGGIDPVQYGLGVELSDTSCRWTQGALAASGVKTDLAIDGDGFFVMRDETGAPIYSRDGSFTLNPSSYLHNPTSGYIVQGWGVDADFNVRSGASLENIRIPIGLLTIAQATTNATLEGNLDSSGSVATGGTKMLSETLYDFRTMVGGNPATLVAADATTPIEYLVRKVDNTYAYLFTNLKSGDEITLSLDKGARTLGERTFTYGDPPPTGGMTLGDFKSFLENTAGINTGTWDGLERTEDTYSFVRVNSSTGEEINGTINAADTVSATQITINGADFSDVKVGDYIVFTSGAVSGQAAEVTGIIESVPLSGNFDTLVLRSDGFNGLEGIAAIGDTYSVHAPAGITLSGGQLLVAGNTGDANDISDVLITHNGSTAVMFHNPSDDDRAAGESLTTTMTVYDSLGTPHQVQVTFVYKSSSTNGPNVFSWIAECADDSDMDRVVGSGTLLFDSDGQFIGEGAGSTDLSIDLQSAHGASAGVQTPLMMNVDFARITDFGGQSDKNGVLLTDQDGFASGTLQDFAIGADGLITGIFSNGLTRDLGQIALARFANNNGLIHEGGNNWRASINSGMAQTGEAITGGRGVVRSGYLEESNVDLAEQFTNLMVGQRAFQANARTITVSDQMLQELVNLI